MSLHTEDKNIALEFTKKPASRILVNTGSAMGGTGASTGLLTSFTLGCGTWGGSSISENVGPMNLINVKRIAYGTKDATALYDLDSSFNYPQLEMEKTDYTPYMAPINTSSYFELPKKKQETYIPTAGYKSPAEYSNSGIGEKVSNAPETFNTCGSGCNACSTGREVIVEGACPCGSGDPLGRCRVCGLDTGFVNEGINQDQLSEMVKALANALRGE